MRTNAKKLGALIGALGLLALAAPAAALAAPVLELGSSHLPADAPVPQGTYARYEVAVSNTGTSATSGPITVDLSTPPGLEVTKATSEPFFGFTFWSCSIAPGAQSASCAGPELEGEPIPIEAGEEACEGLLGDTCRLLITVKADPAALPGALAPTIAACGGGASTCEVVPLDFEVASFDGEALKSNGAPATQAGSHPATASTDFFTTTLLDPSARRFSTENLKDAVVELPPGLLGNPQAVPTCTQAQLLGTGLHTRPLCPPESQVGTVRLHVDGEVGSYHDGPAWGVYNMETAPGTPALFAFNFTGTLTQIYAKLRTGGDYGATVIAKNSPEVVALLPFEGAEFTLWGIPSDPSHDPERYCPGAFDPGCPSDDAAHPKPFLILPTSCPGPVSTFLELSSWAGGSGSASFLSHDNEGTPIGTTGCNALDFSPTLQARPTTNVADAPTGLDVVLHLPQNEAPKGTAEAHLKEATITLPEGLLVNPAAGNGLAACSPAEIDLHGEGGADCPDAAKLGTVQVESPLLDHPLPGALYLATPYENPFGSLIAIYIVIDDPESGTVVKLAGRVTYHPQTGQLTTRFEENPQLPFEDVRIHLFGGAGAPLRTPAICGDYTVTSSLVPWTTPDGATATPEDSWTISQGPNGGPCANSAAEQPHAPSLDAGTVSPIAGAYSPLVVNLRREDGSQEFSEVTFTPPPGLVGRIAGIPFCPDAALEAAAAKSGREELANPSCPAASVLGTTDVAAGAGPAPYHEPAIEYLAGPYKGAPISIAVIGAAVAGPIDLGNVVVRAGLYVDPKTAQITAKSDPIPAILQGIPLDIRALAIRLDRPQFTLNGTSCDPMTFSGQVLSVFGNSASLSNRFQLAECSGLGLRPKMTMRLKGGTKRRAHPALTVTLEPRAGDANLAAISVALPPTELLDNAHIGTVCTRVQFAASECPAASVYGTATVTTPLLDYPLSGNVYLRSSDNPLPDLVPDLRGPPGYPIKLEAAGRTDTVKGGLRNTFDLIPDAPFTKFVLTLPGGGKGLIQNSRDICAKTYRATVKYTAQNGRTLEQRPALKAKCPKGKRHSRRAQRRGDRHGAR
jgi:hypothetical protein